MNGGPMLLRLGASFDEHTGLSIADPVVLGPVAAFIFLIFVTEVIVSGKAYRRLAEENDRLRSVAEKVVPIAEAMVATTSEMLQSSTRMTAVMEEIVNLLAGPDPMIRRRARE